MIKELLDFRFILLPIEFMVQMINPSKDLVNFRVKYLFAPCSFKTLFFALSIFIFFICGTCAI
jgi:hypothetical protein